jgi:RNA polymerase sigma factor (sigma-70 family)
MSVESESEKEIFEDDRSYLEEFLQTRSAESFSALFKILYPQILKYFLTRSLDRMVAEELSQNVLFIVYERVGDLREKNLFFGWLFKVARNEWLQYVRNQQRRNKIARFEPLESESAKTLTVELDMSLNSQFHEWMNHLEKDEREILMLRFIDDLSYEELAVALDIPMGTVKWRLFNAKKKLVNIITA